MSVSTIRGTGNIDSQRQIIDMRDTILLLEPAATPFLVFSAKLGKRTASNPKFEWMEDQFDAVWATLAAAITGGSPTEEIEVLTGESLYFKVGHVVYVAGSNDRAIVTAVNHAAHKYTIKCLTATNLTAALISTKIYIIGSAHMEGSGKGVEQSRLVDFEYNFTQIFKTDYGVTNTLRETALYGGKELARLRNKKGKQHKMGIERAFVFGERTIDVSGTHPKRTTRGAVTFLESAGVNTLATVLASTTQADVEDFLKDLFNNGAYGSLRKLVFAGSDIINLFGSFVTPHYRIMQGDTKFGVPYKLYDSNHGQLWLIKQPLFNGPLSKYALIVDPKNIKYVPLGKRDTMLITGIENNDIDGSEEEYLTEVGLELNLPATHGLMKLT